MTIRTTSRFTSPLRHSRIFDLLAHRRAQSRLDDLGQVGVQRGMREAGHRQCVWPLVARGQGQAEQGGRAFGVVAEHLVEVAHPKQQECVGIACLELAILLHHRCQGWVIHTVDAQRARSGFCTQVNSRPTSPQAYQRRTSSSNTRSLARECSLASRRPVHSQASSALTKRGVAALVGAAHALRTCRVPTVRRRKSRRPGRVG